LPAEVEREAERLANEEVIEAAIETAVPLPVSETESDQDFGMDFPGFVNSESLEEEGGVDDPVAVGGDTSLYGSDTTGTVEVGDDTDDE
jgi:hypothetical protein